MKKECHTIMDVLSKCNSGWRGVPYITRKAGSNDSEVRKNCATLVTRGFAEQRTEDCGSYQNTVFRTTATTLQRYRESLKKRAA
jgi:DNA-binding IclR family transcriptional regulator